MTLLDIAVFATLDANWPMSLDEYVRAANHHLANFDMRLSIHPPRPANPTPLPLVGPVHDRPPDFGVALLAGDVRTAAHAVLPQGAGIPVIFCKFRRTGDAGLTVFTEDRGVNRGIGWLNYVLVNADQLNPQRAVLLHELIHAANYSGDIDPLFGRNLHDSDSSSVMRPSESAQLPIVTMMERHAAALRTAYFARHV